jgi:hypothetical protein
MVFVFSSFGVWDSAATEGDIAFHALEFETARLFQQAGVFVFGGFADWRVGYCILVDIGEHVG